MTDNGHLMGRVRRIDERLEEIEAQDVPAVMPVYNARTMYGAYGDGTTDDTTAIQNAIDAADTAGGGIVYLPGGTYVIDGTLALKNYVTLMGQSNYDDATPGNVTILEQQGGTNNTIRVVSSNDDEAMRVENITITFKDTNRTTGGGLVFEDDGGGAFLGLHIKNVIVRYHGRGIHIENTVESTIEKCRVLNCDTGYLIDVDSSGSGITTTKYDHCFAQNCDDFGWDINAATLASVTFIGCAADACGYGWHFGGATLRNVTMIDCYVEDRASGPDVVSAILSSGTWQGFTVIGLTCYNATGDALDLTGSGDMTIIGGRIANTAATFYDLDTNTSGYINIVGDFKTIMGGSGAGRIRDTNDGIAYADYRTLQSQRLDSGGTSSVHAAHTQYGTETLSGDTGANNVTATISYPEGFSAIHGVVATLQGPTIGGDRVFITVQSVGANSFVLRATTDDGGNFTNTDSEDVFWIAKGVRF